MSQDRLNSLAIINIESGMCDELAFDDTLQESAIMKSRKVNFLNKKMPFFLLFHCLISLK
jgi:hypothetical protein